MTTITAVLQRGQSLTQRADTVWIVVALAFAALGLFAPEQFRPSVDFTIEQVILILPYLALAVVAAAYAGATGADNLIARAFSGSAWVMIPLAALAGAISPFCSCGVIPLIAALLAMGVPLAPVMAFWLASPVMDPSMFVLTAGEVGMDFAVGKTLAAFALGLFGALVVQALMRTPMMQSPLRDGVGNGGCGGAKMRNPKPVVWAFWQERVRTEKFAMESLKTFLFLLKWLTLAYLAESLMLAYLPADAIASVAGDGSLLSIGTAALIGVPAYLNGYAAVPLIGGLFAQGMAPGAGMAFLVAGGVTSIPAAVAVFALVRAPVFALYIALALTGSIAIGLAYQTWTML